MAQFTLVEAKKFLLLCDAVVHLFPPAFLKLPASRLSRYKFPTSVQCHEVGLNLFVSIPKLAKALSLCHKLVQQVASPGLFLEIHDGTMNDSSFKSWIHPFESRSHLDNDAKWPRN